MAKASTKELFSKDAKTIFETIIDYESYPDFLPEVSSCVIKEETAEYKIVEMTVSFIKEATYTIKVFTEENKKVWWELVSGDVFKKNNGTWELEEVGNQTQVTYSLDLDFKIFVPSFVLNKAVKVSLPAMVKNFKKRVEHL